jgi:hypothetical protein
MTMMTRRRTSENECKTLTSAAMVARRKQWGAAAKEANKVDTHIMIQKISRKSQEGRDARGGDGHHLRDEAQGCHEGFRQVFRGRLERKR